MRRAPFRQRDISRAVRGAQAAGIEIARVEIELNTGRISIVPAGLSDNHNELDTELAEFEARYGQD